MLRTVQILKTLWIGCFYTASVLAILTVVLLFLAGTLNTAVLVAQNLWILPVMGALVLLADKFLRWKFLNNVQ